jgi:hypothetical protein
MQIRAIDILVKTPIFDNQFDEHHTLNKLSVITLNFWQYIDIIEQWALSITY